MLAEQPTWPCKETNGSSFLCFPLCPLLLYILYFVTTIFAVVLYSTLCRLEAHVIKSHDVRCGTHAIGAFDHVRALSSQTHGEYSKITFKPPVTLQLTYTVCTVQYSVYIYMYDYQYGLRCRCYSPSLRTDAVSFLDSSASHHVCRCSSGNR
jgi:hypothetical protein